MSVFPAAADPPLTTALPLTRSGNKAPMPPSNRFSTAPPIFFSTPPPPGFTSLYPEAVVYWRAEAHANLTSLYRLMGTKVDSDREELPF